jgi:isoleucyl-tRNA synthetase
VDIEHDVELDTAITPELKKEGQFREFLRTVQGLRKDAKLDPSDVIALTIKTTDDGRALVEMFADELKKTALVREVIFGEAEGEAFDVDGIAFALAIVK